MVSRIEPTPDALIVLRHTMEGAPPMFSRWRPRDLAQAEREVCLPDLQDALADTEVRVLARVPSVDRPGYFVCALAGATERMYGGRLQVRDEEFVDDDKAYTDILGPLCFAAQRADGTFTWLTPIEQGSVWYETTGHGPYPIVRLEGQQRWRR